MVFQVEADGSGAGQFNFTYCVFQKFGVQFLYRLSFGEDVPNPPGFVFFGGEHRISSDGNLTDELVGGILVDGLDRKSVV